MGHDGAVTGAADPPRPSPARRPVVLGVGASRGCPPAELAALVDAALTEADRTRADVVALASADVKADERAVLELAAALEVPTRFLSVDVLRTVTVPTPSAVVAAHVGTPSVAEAAALIAAGELGDRGRSRLLVTKRRSARATCAIAAPPVADAAPRRVVTATDDCRGCGGCISTCPEHALVPVGAAGGIPILTLVDRCTGCGECLEVCPVDAFIEVALP
jgi:cobalt-precorrin 5A hydrolase/cobalt-precorrin 5A hydrolase/precorrin-3B C17-methyltransferase